MVKDEKSLETILSNINIIKDSIEKGKNTPNSLHKLLILYGMTNLIYFLLSTAIQATVSSFSSQIKLITFLNFIVYLSILLYYIKIYNKERLQSNKYYIAFLNIWMGISILLPILQLFTRFIISFTSIPTEEIGQSFMYLNMFGEFSNILLLFFCMIIASFILNINILKSISISILFSYLIVFSVFSNTTIPFSKNIIISFPVVYYYAILSAGYISIGLLLKYGVNTKNGTI